MARVLRLVVYRMFHIEFHGVSWFLRTCFTFDYRQHIASAKQGDNAFGSVNPSICLFLCLLGCAPIQTEKPTNTHKKGCYQVKYFPAIHCFMVDTHEILINHASYKQKVELNTLYISKILLHAISCQAIKANFISIVSLEQSHHKPMWSSGSSLL